MTGRLLNLTTLEREALERAARGDVAGMDWDALISAFETLGWKLPLSIGKDAIKHLAVCALDVLAENR